MTTPYCSRNQWAERKGYATWAAYVAAGYGEPTQQELDSALEDATDIMNDPEHINCKSTNITDTDYTQRLERICYNMANRIMDVERNRGRQGAMFQFSPQDFLFDKERKFLIQIALDKEYRYVGAVG